MTLATLIVCCSIASCIDARSLSWMELNSSIQHTPPSANTSAPASKCHSPESYNIIQYQMANESKKVCSISFRITFTAETVRPALVVPIPVVRIERGLSLHMYLRICDLPAPIMK